MVICGPQKFQMPPPPPPPPPKNPKGAKHGPQNYWPGDNTVTLSLHGRMYYLPKFEAYIKRWDPQFQWWDPHHIQSWVPRTPKHSTRCKTLYQLIKSVPDRANAPVICNHIPPRAGNSGAKITYLQGAVDMPGFWFPPKKRGNSLAFYRVLQAYSAVFWQDIRLDLQYPEMRDFNMAERQQIESKLKMCFILAFSVVLIE